jgi:class 3 adenylate cyclase
MQQIADWLQLGMSEYTQRFAKNGIVFAALRHLTDQDLKDIGVLLGHRRIMLAAIQELGSPAAAQLATVELKPQDTAERRQVTVMFSDLVGSTALSARMDPEDLREVISAYQKCVANTVQRFGGFVAKYMGDGVLIYFGYPQAHEDDAERAVRAGLELVAAVGGLKTHAPLQTRVGVATGLVVVGELIGSGASQEQAIVGETPNLAARLQTLAAPNTLVIADATRRQIGGLFDLADLGQGDGSMLHPQRNSAGNNSDVIPSAKATKGSALETAQRLSHQRRATEDGIAALMRSVIGIAGFMLAIVGPTMTSAATIEEVAHCRAIPQLAERLKCFKSLKPGPRAKTEDAAPAKKHDAGWSKVRFCGSSRHSCGPPLPSPKRVPQITGCRREESRNDPARAGTRERIVPSFGPAGK